MSDKNNYFSCRGGRRNSFRQTFSPTSPAGKLGRSRRSWIVASVPGERYRELPAYLLSVLYFTGWLRDGCGTQIERLGRLNKEREDPAYAYNARRLAAWRKLTSLLCGAVVATPAQIETPSI